MNKAVVFLVGLLLGAGGGLMSGDKIWHWIDVQSMQNNGWIKRSTGADERGRYTLLSNFEGNRVFLKRAYHSGQEQTELGEVECTEAGSLTFKRSGRPTAYDDLPPASVGRALIEELCTP